MNIIEKIEMDWYGIKNYGISFHFQKWVESGKNAIKVDSPEFSMNNNHTAIIIAISSGFQIFDVFKDSVYGEGIDLLINYFLHEKLPYKVHVCEELRCADSVIRDPKVKELWIFGHGKKNYLSFGNNGKLKYQNFSGLEKKDFIAQLHCNTGDGPSLVELLSDGKGIFSDYYRYPIQNRNDIQKWINDQISNKNLKR